MDMTSREKKTMAKIDDIKTDIDKKFSQFALDLEQVPNNGCLQRELNKLERSVFENIDNTYVTAIKIALNAGATVGGHK